MPGEMRVLLTGSSGYLGSFVLRELRRRRLEVVTAGRGHGQLELDLADPDSVSAAVSAIPVQAVLNAAALSSMEACQEDPPRAAAINGRAPGLLAEAVEGRCLQVSTDLVFDGRSAPYCAGDPPGPLSEYGSTKADGERAVLAAGGTVVRVPLLIGPSPDGRRGATDMVRRALVDGRVLTLFTDEFRTPLHVADAARELVDLLLDGERGTVHLAGYQRLSRFELGLHFCDVHGLPTQRLEPTLSSEPRRPKDVSLVGREPGRSLQDALLDC